MSKLDPEQQWGFSLPGLVSHHLGGGCTAWPLGYPHASLFVWLQAQLGGQGLSSSGAAPLGAVGAQGLAGRGRKCSEPGLGVRNVSNALAACAPSRPAAACSPAGPPRWVIALQPLSSWVQCQAWCSVGLISHKERG